MKFKFGESRIKRVTDFREILPGIIADLDIQESFVMGDIRSRWRDFSGDILSSHSAPDRIYKKTLYVFADHPVYANEIMLMKDMIIQRINQGLSAELIHDLRIEIKRFKWSKK